MSEDINSFEYFEEMTADWNRIDLLRRCYDLCNEIVEKQQEIERLNNIIKEVREYIEKCKFEFGKNSSCMEYGVIYDITQILNKGGDKE